MLNFVHTMYDNNYCDVRFGGVNHEGFHMKGGVRQGCPLSPVLCVVCIDILLRKLEQVVPGCMCRAFADDIALVLRDRWAQGPKVQQLFQEFVLISNLYVNVDICVFL